MSLNATLDRLENFSALKDFKFGHTPLQLEYFQTSSQRGNEKWEYWQHVLQLRALHSTLEDLQVTANEVEFEIQDALSFWPFWTKERRRRKLPRLKLKKEQIQRSLDEKALEADRHLGIIEKRYAHLKDIKEDEILKDETSYWTLRLGRQLGAAHLGRVLGIPEGDLLAVLALPHEQQRQVFDSMKLIINASTSVLQLEQK